MCSQVLSTLKFDDFAGTIALVQPAKSSNSRVAKIQGCHSTPVSWFVLSLEVENNGTHW